MKRIISLLLALCLLAGCAISGAESRTPEGKPWVNSNLLEYLAAERPLPEDSFDMYANYDAYREVLASGSTTTLSSLEEAEIISRGQILSLCTNTAAECTEDEILRILYGLVMDLEKRNADGLAPLMAKVDQIKAAKTTDDLLALQQKEYFLPCDTFFSIYVQEAQDGSGRTVLITDRKTVLEDKPLDHEAEIGVSYNLEKDTETPKARLMHMQYSEEEAAALVERMKEYNDYYPNEAVEWPEGKYLTIEQVKERSPILYAQLIGNGMVKEGPVCQVEPELIEAVNHFFTDENLDLLKAIMILSIYQFSMDYLDEETWKTEGSWDNDYEPEKNIYYILEDMATIVVDQAYLKHFCPEENQETVLALFEEIKDAMRNRITQNTWIDEETRKTALEKLELIVVAPFATLGGMFDCEPLKTALQSCTTLLDAAAVCRCFRQRCMLRYIGEPYVKGSRYMPDGGRLMNSNGHYDPTVNMIFIGAPALNMPMFNNKSKATLLGSIGHHLAHELSHAFSVGALTDATGERPLYTEETGKLFMEKANAMIEKMNQIEPFDGVKLNGSGKISELMPDVTGVCLSLDIAKKTEGFDYAEFFTTYASFLRSSSPDREKLLQECISGNPHPLPYIRVNYVVAQFDEFYETYPSVREGTPMYVAPEDRILIW